MLASKGEKKIHDILKSAGFDFIEEYSFADLLGMRGIPLRFDFAVFDDDGCLLCLIEYQGKQHYQPVEVFGGRDRFNRQKRYDARKIDYCRKRNIRLVIIPFEDEAKIDYDYIVNEIYR